MTQRMTLTVRGESDPIEIERRAVAADGDDAQLITVDGAETTVIHEAAADGRSGTVRIDDRLVTYYAVRRKDQIDIWIDGVVYAFDIVTRTAQRSGGGAAAGSASDLTAPMPGTVLQIAAAAGSIVEAHDPVIIMESMKMEMTVSAPARGRVKEVLCAEGDLVEMGARLAHLEPLEDDHDDG